MLLKMFLQRLATGNRWVIYKRKQTHLKTIADRGKYGVVTPTTPTIHLQAAKSFNTDPNQSPKDSQGGQDYG